jgi:hypothetical protein
MCLRTLLVLEGGVRQTSIECVALRARAPPLPSGHFPAATVKKLVRPGLGRLERVLEVRSSRREEEGGGGSGTALPPPPLTVVHPNRAFSRGRHTHRHRTGRRPPLSSTQPQRTCCAQFLLPSADHSIIYSSVRHDAASSFQLLHPRPPMCRLLSALLSSASFLPHAHALNLLNTLAHMKEQFGRYWFWIASGR